MRFMQWVNSNTPHLRYLESLQIVCFSQTQRENLMKLILQLRLI